MSYAEYAAFIADEIRKMQRASPSPRGYGFLDDQVGYVNVPMSCLFALCV